MRLIDADALDLEWLDYTGNAGRDAKFYIDNIPTVDAKPVIHAKWIENEDLNGDSFYTCSNCDNDFFCMEGTPNDNEMNFCPRCGAKMEDEEENE